MKAHEDPGLHGVLRGSINFMGATQKWMVKQVRGSWHIIQLWGNLSTVSKLVDGDRLSNFDLILSPLSQNLV